ncbi:MAG: hypothetical protein AAF745_09795, partial [Planctomycetota bacterium]
VVTTRPNSIEQFEQWLSSDPLAGKDTSLVTDDADLASSPISDHFDEITLIDEPVAITAASIEETRWAALMAVAMTALERKRVVWVHSRFLITAWDAPRDLFKDTHFHDVDEDDDDALPARFNDVIPPKITLDGSEHPDLLAAWMRTYGCQIQLIDTMLEVILQTIDPTLPIVLAGTSGYCLGQRNRIDHRYRLDANGSFCGASALYRVPMLTNLHTGLRVPELTALDQLAELIRAGINTTLPSSELSPTSWATSQAETPGQESGGQESGGKESSSEHSLIIRDENNTIAIQTETWFLDVVTRSLFLRPDDVHDINDVCDLRGDVVESLLQRADVESRDCQR